MTTLLEADGLGFVYQLDARRIEVLRQVSFRVEAGDYVAIQGPSGSGKSTLFYILGCLLRPSSGQVLLDGVALSRLSDDSAAVVRNRMIGFIFQQFHLLARATVLDNILLPAAYPAELPHPLSQAHREKALVLAERLGLKDHLTHLPSQLSGGQQQRVAVARALLNDVSLILADEPTGNLDSRSTEELLTVFGELHAQGRTIVVITHDPDVARRCSKVLHVRDGTITSVDAPLPPPASEPAEPAISLTSGILAKPAGWNTSLLRLAALALPGAFRNLTRNRLKSLLTMLGILIGIAAVLAMISLGQFTKQRIVEGFEALGVNKLVVLGYPNADRQATDVVATPFLFFDWEQDLAPLRRIFPAIRLISPVLTNFQNTVTAGGRSVTEDVRLRGVGVEYMAISNAHLAAGRAFTPYDVTRRAAVCILGADIGKRLFGTTPPFGQLVTVAIEEQRSFPCEVIGVLTPQKSNQEWLRPNLQILVPFTSFQAAASYWSSQINEFTVQVRSEAEVAGVAAGIKAYFNQRYGKAGRFIVDTEGTLVAQTKRFLNIFALLLAAVAFLSLLVGGIGIHNMMLISVTDRIKEIGLRKAVGATNRSIKVQVLTEAALLCALAGLLGIAAGFGVTELMIWAATKFVTNLNFEWVFDPWAFAVSAGSIVVVGLLSGLVPALRAERLQVIEALRAE